MHLQPQATNSVTAKIFFFFNDTATTEIYTLSLHDALPICDPAGPPPAGDRRSDHDRQRTGGCPLRGPVLPRRRPARDRKSTRLNSSHSQISYAVFCLKKKKKLNYHISSKLY